MTYSLTSKQENFRNRTGSFSTHGNRSTLESINTIQVRVKNNHKLIPLLDKYFKLRDDCRRARKNLSQKKWRFNKGACSIGSIESSEERLNKLRKKRDSIKDKIDGIGVKLTQTWYSENYVKRPN